MFAACEDKTDIVIPPADIAVNAEPDEITVAVGQTRQIVANVTGGESTTVRTANFVSNNTAVATVSPATGNTATVTGVAVGSAQIVVTSTADATKQDIVDGKPDFSFSGIKTAMHYHIRKHDIPPVASADQVPDDVKDLLASFQRAVVTALVSRMREAAVARRPKSLLLTGGVAANSRLRDDAATAAHALGLPLFVPPIALSTDNAAMIAAAGYVAWQRGVRGGFDLTADPHLSL
jgi:tRNA A37 threonylcarbamoyltransferase TsaD